MSDVFDQKLLNLVNQERAKAGEDALKINDQLDRAADLHTADQASMDSMTHSGSDGSSLGDRVKEAGYDFSKVKENVSQVALDPETVMYGGTVGSTEIQGWMDSPGHRSNILSSEVDEIGMGFETSADGNPYWTQVFGADFA